MTEERGEDAGGCGGGDCCSVAGASMEAASTSFSQWKTSSRRSSGDDTDTKGVSCSRSRIRDGDKSAFDIVESQKQRAQSHHRMAVLARTNSGTAPRKSETEDVMTDERHWRR